MPTLQQLEDALLNADRNGNTADAKLFAEEIMRMRQAPEPAPVSAPPQAPGIGAIRMDQSTFAPRQAGPGVGMSPRGDQVLRDNYLDTTVQGVGAGLAEAIGTVPDLMNVMNPVKNAYDTYQQGAKLTGLPQGPDSSRLFPSYTDRIKDHASDVFTAVTDQPVQNSSNMSGPDNLRYHGSRMLTQALATFPALRALGLARAAEVEGGNLKPNMFDSFTRPYSDPSKLQTARTLAGDLAAGAGSGAVISGLDQTGFRNPATEFAGTMGGGVAGNTALNMITALPRAGKAMLSNIFGASTKIPLDPNVPFHLQQPPDAAVVKNAAAVMQGGAFDKASALDQINMNQTTLGDTMTVAPRTGAMSEDVGVQRLEQGLRQRNPMYFDENQRQFNSSALDAVEQKTVPRDADASVFQAAAKDEVRTRQADAQAFSDQADTAAQQTDFTRRQAGIPFTELQNPPVPASQALHRSFVDQSLDPMSRTKSLDFAQAPNAPTRTREIYEAAGQIADDIERQLPGFREQVDPGGGILRGIESLAIRDQETGALIGTRPHGLQDLNKMRSTLSSMEAKARDAPGGADPGLLDNLRRLRNVISTVTDAHPDNARAVDRFETQFAPVWGRQNPEAHAFREKYQLDSLGESKVPPEKTADQFIKPDAPTVSAQVQRIVGSMERPAEAQQAIERVLRADLAKSGAVDRNGHIVPEQIDAWIQKNQANIDLVPGFRDRLTGPQGVRTVGEAGVAAAARSAEDVRVAGVAKQTVDAIIKESGLDDVVKAGDLDKMMVNVLGDQTSSGAKLDNLISLAKERGPAAENGLKKAISTWLVDKAETNNVAETKAGDMRGSLSWPKINKVIKEHETELAKIYSPEEMQALRRVHHAMALKAGGEQRTGAGSTDAVANQKINPVDRLRDTALGKGVESIARFHMGALAAGGKIGAIRRAFHGVNDQQAAEIEKLLVRASFEPEVAQMLLGQKLGVGTPKWNKRMSILLGTGEAIRDDGEDEDPAAKRAAARKAMTPGFMLGAP